jgi:hypothetical protein
VVLEADPVKIEGRGAQQPVLMAAVVLGHQGQGVGGNLLGPQGLQGQDIVAGPAPVAGRQLEKVGGDLLGDDRRLFQELFAADGKPASSFNP